jgi:hypothetical protein
MVRVIPASPSAIQYSRIKALRQILIPATGLTVRRKPHRAPGWGQMMPGMKKLLLNRGKLW